jgi:hypothetical protein
MLLFYQDTEMASVNDEDSEQYQSFNWESQRRFKYPQELAHLSSTTCSSSTTMLVAGMDMLHSYARWTDYYARYQADLASNGVPYEHWMRDRGQAAEDPWIIYRSSQEAVLEEVWNNPINMFAVEIRLGTWRYAQSGLVFG